VVESSLRRSLSRPSRVRATLAQRHPLIEDPARRSATGAASPGQRFGDAGDTRRIAVARLTRDVAELAVMLDALQQATADERSR
jgi:hypothetical protein